MAPIGRSVGLDLLIIRNVYPIWNDMNNFTTLESSSGDYHTNHTSPEAQGLACSARGREDKTSCDRIPAGGDVASVGRQVKLCDPIGLASYCSAETVVTALNTL